MTRNRAMMGYKYKIVDPEGGNYTFIRTLPDAQKILKQLRKKYPTKVYEVKLTTEYDYSDDFWTSLEDYCLNL